MSVSETLRYRRVLLSWATLTKKQPIWGHLLTSSDRRLVNFVKIMPIHRSVSDWHPATLRRRNEAERFRQIWSKATFVHLVPANSSTSRRCSLAAINCNLSSVTKEQWLSFSETNLDHRRGTSSMSSDDNNVVPLRSNSFRCGKMASFDTDSGWNQLVCSRDEVIARDSRLLGRSPMATCNRLVWIKCKWLSLGQRFSTIA